MSDQWKSVFITTHNHKAEICKAMLQHVGIPVVIVNKRDSSYPLGYYEVHVNQNDVLRAIKLMNEKLKFE